MSLALISSPVSMAQDESVQPENPPINTPSPGVYENRIVFGQSAALEGPAASLGQGMSDGIRAAFNEINQAGGVSGRQLELLTLNDGYEPDQAISNSRRLIQEERVFALIGGVGTPTSRAVLPIVNAEQTPYIAPFTGAGLLRDPESYAVNLRASYDQETHRIVQFLTGSLGLDRIAIVYQDDSYGQAGFNGIEMAMRSEDRELVATGTYPRNTLAIKTALLDIRSAKPQAIVIIGAYAPTAELIRWGKKIGLDVVYITISFVGSQALAEALGDEGIGVYVTQVVPTYAQSEMPAAGDFIGALDRFVPDATPSFVSFEGYLAGRMTVEVLQKVGPNLSRERFMDKVKSMGFQDLGGFELRFGLEDNQGSDEVFLTMIGPDGRYRAVQTPNGQASGG